VHNDGLVPHEGATPPIVAPDTLRLRVGGSATEDSAEDLQRSGEDYLFPRSLFAEIRLSAEVAAALSAVT